MALQVRVGCHITQKVAAVLIAQRRKLNSMPRLDHDQTWALPIPIETNKTRSQVGCKLTAPLN